jgi:hypothetical protein
MFARSIRNRHNGPPVEQTAVFRSGQRMRGHFWREMSGRPASWLSVLANSRSELFDNGAAEQ